MEAVGSEVDDWLSVVETLATEASPSRDDAVTFLSLYVWSRE